jgi:hypothetical protein
VTDADAQTHTDEAAARVRAYIDASERYGPYRQDLIDSVSAGGGMRKALRAADLRAVLDALADTQERVAQLTAENRQLAKTVNLNAAIAEEANDENDHLRAECDGKRARAVAAEARVAELEAETTERQWGLRWSDGDISICADEENARYRVEHYPQYQRTVVYRDLRRSEWRDADPVSDATTT